jgi:glycosyltransferase involved in cell wall biosynthesis
MNLASDLANNDDIKRYIETKITVIHNGIDEHKFKPPKVIEKNVLKNQILEKYAFKKRANPLIVFIGRLSPQKGLVYLIDSLYLLKKKNYDFNCMIIGRLEDNNYLKLLKSKINKYSLDDSVKINASGVSNVADYYAISDIAVHPSIVNEGLSYSLLESMASSCAVITAESGGNVEAIKNGSNGLIIPKKDSESLMRAIIKILDDPSFAEKIRKNARDTVLDNFTIDKHVKNLLTSIERIMN